MEENQEIFEYLDAVYLSGSSMMGIGRQLADEFGISVRDARKAAGEWMRVFQFRHMQG